jgi:hypothetical protein
MDGTNSFWAAAPAPAAAPVVASTRARLFGDDIFTCFMD